MNFDFGLGLACTLGDDVVGFFLFRSCCFRRFDWALNSFNFCLTFCEPSCGGVFLGKGVSVASGGIVRSTMIEESLEEPVGGCVDVGATVSVGGLASGVELASIVGGTVGADVVSWLDEVDGPGVWLVDGCG